MVQQQIGKLVDTRIVHEWSSLNEKTPGSQQFTDKKRAILPWAGAVRQAAWANMAHHDILSGTAKQRRLAGGAL
jgi:hypothetical protein